MGNPLTTIAAQIVESVLAIVGIRVGAEEPSYSSEPLTDAIEIRRYQPRIAAETTVEGDERRALQEGFRRLAGYIFGGNHQSSKIAMSAPVSQASAKGQKIAMTAPVSRAADHEHGWVVQFFMPSKWTMATLPEPNDARVRLVHVPGETVAVLRFGGIADEQAITARSAQLAELLLSKGIQTTGDPVAWFYDPPWTLPFRRRNEVAVPVAS
jgi:SOUL heme-binding protein